MCSLNIQSLNSLLWGRFFLSITTKQSDKSKLRQIARACLYSKPLTLNAEDNKKQNSKVNGVCSGNHDKEAILRCKHSNYLFRCMMLSFCLVASSEAHAGPRGRMGIIFRVRLEKYMGPMKTRPNLHPAWCGYHMCFDVIHHFDACVWNRTFWLCFYGILAFALLSYNSFTSDATHKSP